MLVTHDLEIFTSVHQSNDYGLDETIVTTHHQVVENQNKGYLTLRNIQCATMKITDLSDEILLKILGPGGWLRIRKILKTFVL